MLLSLLAAALCSGLHPSSAHCADLPAPTISVSQSSDDIFVITVEVPPSAFAPRRAALAKNRRKTRIKLDAEINNFTVLKSARVSRRKRSRSFTVQTDASVLVEARSISRGASSPWATKAIETSSEEEFEDVPTEDESFSDIPSDTQGPSCVFETPPSMTPCPPGLDQEMLEALNAVRIASHVPPLELDVKLSATATYHSHKMASEQRMSHDGWTDSFTLCGYLLTNISLSQNIFAIPVGASAAQSAESVVSLLATSPSHNANQLDSNKKKFGFGCVIGADMKMYGSHNFSSN